MRIPIFLPIGAEDNFEGVIDVVNQKAIVWGPGEAQRRSELRSHRHSGRAQGRGRQAALAELIDAVSNKDDAIAELVLEDKPIDAADLEGGHPPADLQDRTGSRAVRFGVQEKGRAGFGGCGRGLSAQPAGRSRRRRPGAGHGKRGRGRNRTTTINSARWRSSFGPIPTPASWCFFRVYSGQLKKGDTIYNPRTRKRERVSRLMVIQGSERKDIDDVYAGDIAALVGLRNITTGDTLCDEDFDVTLEPPTFPEPVISHGRRAEDQGRIATRCPKACNVWRKKIRRSAASPTKKPASSSSRAWVSCTWKSSSTVLFREFKVDANTGAPQIAYRETITKAAEGEGKFIRQSGGRGQYGHACITVEPNEKGKGVEVENKIVGGAIPKEYIPAVIDGIEEAIKGGVYAGYQVIDIKVEVVDGSFHEVDSNELAFKMAGIFALKDAFKKAGPILLEPIMKVEVHHAG